MTAQSQAATMGFPYELTSRDGASAAQPYSYAQDPFGTEGRLRPHSSIGKSESVVSENSSSLIAIVVSMGYVVLAVTTGIVLFGIIPGWLAFSSFQKGEKLAPVAAFAAACAATFAIMTRTMS